jgi:hypothetical protein
MSLRVAAGSKPAVGDGGLMAAVQGLGRVRSQVQVQEQVQVPAQMPVQGHGRAVEAERAAVRGRAKRRRDSPGPQGGAVAGRVGLLLWGGQVKVP